VTASLYVGGDGVDDDYDDDDDAMQIGRTQ